MEAWMLIVALIALVLAIVVMTLACTAALTLIAAPVTLTRALWRYIMRRTPDTHGSAHWATPAERADLTHEGSGIVLGHIDGETLVDQSEGHVLVLGPPGARKSRSVFAPTLERWSGSVVVNDVKGELHTLTAKHREQYGPVYRIAPTLEESDPLNVMDLIRWNTERAMGDCQRLVMALTADPDEDRFRIQAQELLPGVLLHCQAIGLGDLASVRRWMTSALPRERIKELGQSAMGACQETAMQFRALTDNMQSMAWSSALKYLRLWADPLIARHTASSALDLATLQTDTRPVSVYLVVPEGDMRRLQPWLRVTTELLVARLMDAEVGTQRHPLLLALDEARALGDVPVLPTALAMLRGYRVRCVLGYQSLKQMKETYGPQTAMMDSLRTWWVSATGDPESGEVISRKLGSTTRVRLSTNASQYWWSRWTRFQETEVHTERRLLQPAELSTLDPHVAIILRESHSPIPATKYGLEAPAPLSTLPHLTPARKTRMLVGVNVAVILLAGLWWVWPRPDASQQQTGTMVPVFTPPTRDRQLSLTTPEPPRGRMTIREWSQLQPGRGWALWQITVGSGLAVSPFPWTPDRQFPTRADCEAGKAQRIDAMAKWLASQLQATGATTMTEHGWRSGASSGLRLPKGQEHWRTQKEVLWVCAPWTEGS